MDAAVKRDIRLINTAGVLGTLYGRLTAGEILIFFITQVLGIATEQWALASALIPLASILHLVSGVITEHLGRRKLVSLTCFAAARLATPFITLVPFFFEQADADTRLFYVAVALIGERCINAFGISAWMSWVADVVPEKERGRYYAGRLAMNTAVSVGILFGAGWLIDVFEEMQFPGYTLVGYSLVFAFAFLVGELDLLIHARVADRPMPEQKQRPKLRGLLAAPWRHQGFRNLMLFRIVKLFGDHLAGPFALMYLVESLRLSKAQVMLLTGVIMAVEAVSYGMWRRVGERLGYRNVLRFCSTLSGLGIVYWWFLAPDKPLVLYAVLIGSRLGFGVLVAGNTLAISTLTMNVAPKENRSMYFAQVQVIIALTMSLGILCGRWLFLWTDPAEPWVLPGLGTRLTGVHVLIGLTGLFRLAAVRLFAHRIPEARGAAAMPRISRIMRTNPLRIFPAALSFERPLSPEERDEHIAAMRQYIPTPREAELEQSLRTVLKDELAEEEEFHHIIEQMRSDRAGSIERVMKPIRESAALHRKPVRVKAETLRIQRLYAEGRLSACLRAVQRLAYKTNERLQSEKSEAAVAVIDGLVENMTPEQEPHEEAVLLALYAYLQMVREPEDMPPPGAEPRPGGHTTGPESSA
jgi:Na+/melibiose symporter-like transporter